MVLDKQRFFRYCKPSKTLDVRIPEDRQLYIDFSPVRGGRIIEELRRTITSEPDEPSCQLFTGHIGCGKSTELKALQAKLEEKNFHVVYFESSDTLDLGDVEVTDILLAIAHKVTKSLEASQISIKSSSSQVIRDIADFLRSLDIGLEGELSIGGIAKVTAKVKENPNHRNRLKQYLEPLTTSILQEINQRLLKPAIDKLRENGKEGLVVIVDNLEKVDNYSPLKGYAQGEYLFLQRGDRLKQLNCHLVYTMPLALYFSDSSGVLADKFGDTLPRVLPMVPVRYRDGSPCDKGMVLLQQMIMKRAFPGLSWEQSRQYITKVFDDHTTLERLCLISGGHVRNALRLLHNCLLKEDSPVSRQCLENVIKQNCNFLAITINPEEWVLLSSISQTKTIKGSREEQEEYLRFIRSLFVFEYHEDNESWFDINPILAESKDFKDLI
jgi:AAA ATPase domain